MLKFNFCNEFKLINFIVLAGSVAYSVVKVTGNSTADLYKYIAAQEPNCTLEDFIEWETVEVDISNTEEESDEELTDMMSSWQLIQEKDKLLETQLIGSDEDENQLLIEDEPQDSDLETEWNIVNDVFSDDGELANVLRESFEGEFDTFV